MSTGMEGGAGGGVGGERGGALGRICGVTIEEGLVLGEGAFSDELPEAVHVHVGGDSGGAEGSGTVGDIRGIAELT